MSASSRSSSSVSLSGMRGVGSSKLGSLASARVVCCDRAVDVEVKEVKMASVGAGAGIVVMWCRGCDEYGRGSGVDDGGHALVTDVAVYLVVDVGVSVGRRWVSGAGSCGEAGVVATVVRGGVLHLGRGS